MHNFHLVQLNSRTVLIFSIGAVVIKTLSTITGLVIYAKYSDCDVLSTKRIAKYDQLLPYYVTDVAGHVPGLPGLFFAGIISVIYRNLTL